MVHKPVRVVLIWGIKVDILDYSISHFFYGPNFVHLPNIAEINQWINEM